MAKFRYHRGGLRESMETVIEVFSKQDIVNKLNSDRYCLCNDFLPENITIKPYGYDERIDWSTHIVIINDGTGSDQQGIRGLVGFTDGPLD